MTAIRLLFADADPAFRVYARYTLERLGFDVTATSDGAELMARFAPNSYDVVLVSLAIPFLDGLQVLRAIKQSSPTTPVIVLCDEECSSLAEQSKQEGAFAYFTKPLHDFIPLSNALREAYAHSQTVRATATTVSIPFAQTLAGLIQTAHTSTLNESLLMCLTLAAQLVHAPYGLMTVSEGDAFKVVSTVGMTHLEAARHDWLVRLGHEVSARVLATQTTQIEQLSDELAGHYLVALALQTSEIYGALILYPHSPPDSTQLAQLQLLAMHGALIIELARLREENLRLGSTDPVTGVLKPEVFLELADREFRRSWRYQQPITVIIVDIDDLSLINQQYGYSFGNRVLQMTAQTCTNTIRSIDLIGRYSGDALAILLLMTEGRGAQTVAERLRMGINALRLTNEVGTVQITASLGVCSYPRSGCTSIFDLLTLAQEAQYAAHVRGANQIVYC
jgi:diguanylate cyclase (GGDEF)-like protein